MSSIYVCVLEQWSPVHGKETFIEGVFTNETMARDTFHHRLTAANTNQCHKLLRCEDNQMNACETILSGWGEYESGYSRY